MSEATYTLHTGDALAILPTLPDCSVDAVITDPPYSSGGFTRSDRMANPKAKYCQNGEDAGRASFTGDNRDQRAWTYWCSLWLGQCLHITRPGGYCLLFTDWRQLPAATDAIQAGGWIWRGIVAWDKGPSARAANQAYFRHQCEYVVWGTNGTSDAYTREDQNGPWPGCFQFGVKQDDKHHMTGKPTSLMQQLVQCCPVGGTVLDPFMGSGTTGVACLREGRKFIGVELSPKYVEIARGRMGELVTASRDGQPDLFAQLETANDYQEGSQ